MDRLWLRILALWLIGVLAAAQFPKMSIIAPALRGDYGLSLTGLGWLISLMEVGGGLFGLVAGLALARYGVRRFLWLGLAILALASLAEALATTATVLFAARAVEGIGYVLTVIAAPTAIAATADDRLRPRALALWSTFVPVGIAVGGAITGLATGVLSTRGVLLAWALVIALAVPVALRLPVAGTQSGRIRFPQAAAWVSTFGFGLYTVFISALTMLLPSFLIERGGATVGAAAAVTALASLAALPGSALAMGLMRRGQLGIGRTVLFTALALLPTAPLVPLIYMGAEAGAGLATTGAVAVLAVAVSGLMPPLLFARLPLLAGARAADDPRIATTNGLLTQFGAGGALIGPPLGGLVVEWAGWDALGAALALLVLVMLAVIVAAEWLGAGAREARADCAA